jgi:hypothetical protein
MIFCMKTTLIIPDEILRQLKKRAAQRGATLSAIVAETLKQGLRPARAMPADPPPLPTHHMGEPLVDIADRDALYRAMERA